MCAIKVRFKVVVDTQTDLWEHHVPSLIFVMHVRQTACRGAITHPETSYIDVCLNNGSEDSLQGLS